MLCAAGEKEAEASKIEYWFFFRENLKHEGSLTLNSFYLPLIVSLIPYIPMHTQSCRINSKTKREREKNSQKEQKKNTFQ